MYGQRDGTITRLVGKTFKNELSRRAKAANLFIGEFVRRAAEAYRPEEDEKLIDGLGTGQALHRPGQPRDWRRHSRFLPSLNDV